MVSPGYDSNISFVLFSFTFVIVVTFFSLSPLNLFLLAVLHVKVQNGHLVLCEWLLLTVIIAPALKYYYRVGRGCGVMQNAPELN